MPKNKTNRKIDIIIPAYNVPDNILFRCLSSIACQDIISELEVQVGPLKEQSEKAKEYLK